MQRADINDYAYELLEFLNAFHEQLKADLRARYSDDWLAQDVERDWCGDARLPRCADERGFRRWRGHSFRLAACACSSCASC